MARTLGERSVGAVADVVAAAAAALLRRHPLHHFHHNRYRRSVGILRSTCDRLLLTAAVRTLPSSSSRNTPRGDGITGAIVTVSTATGIATGGCKRLNVSASGSENGNARAAIGAVAGVGVKTARGSIVAVEMTAVAVEVEVEGEEHDGRGTASGRGSGAGKSAAVILMARRARTSSGGGRGEEMGGSVVNRRCEYVCTIAFSWHLYLFVFYAFFAFFFATDFYVQH